MISGVKLVDSGEFSAEKLVASNASPVHVALSFLNEEDLGHEVVDKMRRIEHTAAQMTIWLALDRPLEYACGLEPQESLYVHATEPGLEFFDDLLAQTRSGTPPERPMLLFVNEGDVDPSRVPEGKSSLKLLVIPLPYEIRDDATEEVSTRTWAEAAAPYADGAIDLAEQYAPGLRARILAQTVQDPVTMSVECPDCVQGDVSHVAQTASQSGANRPIPEMGGYRTPIPNLYLCGSGSHPGSGVTMACGRNAAAMICNDLGLAFPPDR